MVRLRLPLARPSLIDGRVPAREHPVSANGQRIGVITQLKGCDGGAGSRGQANNAKAVFAPAEMLKPALRSGVKERYRLSGMGIDAVSPVALKIVAQGAAKPEITLFG